MQPSRKPLSTQVFQGFESLTLRHYIPWDDWDVADFAVIWIAPLNSIPSEFWVVLPWPEHSRKVRFPLGPAPSPQFGRLARTTPWGPLTPELVPRTCSCREVVRYFSDSLARVSVMRLVLLGALKLAVAVGVG